MNKCQDCKYWREIEKYKNSNPRGECNKITDLSFSENAWVYAGIDTDASLMTNPLFGCSLFESK